MMHNGVSIIKGFTLKSEGANINYVGGHCSFLRIFVCNKKNYHLEENLAKFG